MQKSGSSLADLWKGEKETLRIAAIEPKLLVARDRLDLDRVTGQRSCDRDSFAGYGS